MPRPSCIRLLLLAPLLAGLGSCRSDPPPRPDIVIVTIDTLRWDHVGVYGSGETPTLDAMAARGTRFEHAVSVAPITLPSHTSLMTGLYPFHHGVRANGFYRVDPGQETLAESLKAEGYRTGAFVSGFPIESRFGLDQGFDHYDDAFTRMEGGGSAYEAERPADQTITRSLDWWKKTPGPRFLWIHLYDPHAEYEAPAPWAERLAPYPAEIAYTDAQLARLWDEIGERPDALTVVLADHGESLGEHGEKTHTIFVYDATIRIPMVVVGGPSLPGHVVKEPVSLVDVAPTLLDYLRMPDRPLDGASLVSALAGGEAPADRPLYFESYVPRLEFGWSQLTGIRRGRHKLIVAPTPEVYDTVADPGELENLGPTDADLLMSLQADFDALLAGSDLEHESRTELDAEAIEALQSLGYLEGGGTATPEPTGELPDPKVMIALQPRIDNSIRLMSRHRDREAAQLLQSVLEEDPGNAFATQLLSSAHVRMGDPERALAVLEAGLSLAPPLTQSALHASSGDILRRLGRLDDSEQHLRTALAINPSNLQAYDLLGLTLLAAERHDDARVVLEEGLRRTPGHARTLCSLAEVDLAQDRLEQAQANFEQALADPAVAPRAQLGLAVIARSQSDLDAMKRWLQALAETDAEITVDPESFQRAGTLAAESGAFDLAVPIFERALAVAPGHAGLIRDLGVALSRAGRLPQAIQTLTRAFELAPEDASIANALGTAQARSGAFAEAVATFEAAARLAPEDAMIRQNLEMARRAQEEPR